MSDKMQNKNRNFKQAIEVREKRKIRARSKNQNEIWFGLGMFGVVGWSVAVPTVLGAFAGIWIDLRWAGGYSWTLMLIVIGLIIGYCNAWFWINRQRKGIDLERENGSD